jgi:hypothetical protein
VRGRGILRSSQRVGSSEKLASLGPFIVNSSPLAMVMVGWVYLLSSSFSFPELLVGFPRAHPSHLLYFSGECVEDKVSEVRRGVCLPFAFRLRAGVRQVQPPRPTRGNRVRGPFLSTASTFTNTSSRRALLERIRHRTASHIYRVWMCSKGVAL